MHRKWALQDAKNRFSAVVDQTLKEGPQIITRRGVPIVIITPYTAEYGNPEKESFVDFFKNSPLNGLELDLRRDDSGGREVSL
jgi:prevent-host-death family protein